MASTLRDTFSSFNGNAPTGATFCPNCGTLLQLGAVNPICCERCNFHLYVRRPSKNYVVTKSETRSIPDWLSTADIKKTKKDTGKDRMTVDEPCPKCSHSWVEFYTVQLRSVDEGSTVFYECPSCGHNWSQNN